MVKELCWKGITTLNLSCVGTQTALVFFISHVTTISFAPYVNGTHFLQTPISKDPLNTSSTLLLAFLLSTSHNLFLPKLLPSRAERVLLNNRMTKVLPFCCLHCTYLSLTLKTPFTSHASWKHTAYCSDLPVLHSASFFASRSTSGYLTFSGLLCLLAVSPSDNLLWRP